LGGRPLLLLLLPAAAAADEDAAAPPVLLVEGLARKERSYRASMPADVDAPPDSSLDLHDRPATRQDE
jgi:hypothetical protein